MSRFRVDSNVLTRVNVCAAAGEDLLLASADKVCAHKLSAMCSTMDAFCACCYAD